VVEQLKGALEYMLGKYECLNLYPVPSTMSASMRQALYPSGAKNDPRDADLLLDMLLQNRDREGLESFRRKVQSSREAFRTGRADLRNASSWLPG
jgi:hypothetical protein